jgi:DNA-binding SARP family transcriptional activator
LALESIRIQLCGSLAIEVDGRRREGDVPGRQGLVLLAYLVMNRRRPIAREELLAAIWGDNPPPQPYTALRALVSKLRGIIGTEFVTGRDPVRIVLPAGTSVDLETAREALHRAEAALARGDAGAAWGPARVCLLTAERGFLSGLSGEWIDAERRALAGLGRRALLCVAEAGIALAGTELPAAEKAALRLVADSPLEETGHRLLMAALAARGEVSGALQTYETLRQRLREELGADPGPETRALHGRLLTLATAADEISPAPPPRREGSPRPSAPAPPE